MRQKVESLTNQLPADSKAKMESFQKQQKEREELRKKDRAKKEIYRVFFQ